MPVVSGYTLPPGEAAGQLANPGNQMPMAVATPVDPAATAQAQMLNMEEAAVGLRTRMNNNE